jgi:hypothetical protein
MGLVFNQLDMAACVLSKNFACRRSYVMESRIVRCNQERSVTRTRMLKIDRMASFWHRVGCMLVS